MRCRHCKGELIHHYASAYKCDNCGKVFDMFEEESFEDLKKQIESEKEMNTIPTPSQVKDELHVIFEGKPTQKQLEFIKVIEDEWNGVKFTGTTKKEATAYILLLAKDCCMQRLNN